MVGTAKGLRRALSIELWRLVLPVLWMGMVGAISFIEAPLKFQAPGITIPLGLGIGRLVFFALNAAEVVVLITLVLLAFLPRASRLVGARLRWLIALAVVVVVKIAVVRPPLNARTDQVLAGVDAGGSPWHYIYIALEVATLVLLVVASLSTARAILNRISPGEN